MRALNFAIIGVSKFAKFCFESWLKIEQLSPVAVWNRTTQRAKEFAQRYGLQAFDNLTDLLSDDKIQIVYIATAPVVHAKYSIMALQAGKHVLCEKPMAITLSDAQHMAQTADKYKRRLSVNFIMRFGPLANVVRQIITSNILGIMLRGIITNCASDDGLPPEHWFWDYSQSGGIFIEHGVHFFDLVRYWLGNGEVSSAQQIYRPGTNQCDQVSCEVFYPPQSSVSYYHGFHQSHHLDHQQINLIFERGEIVLYGWIADTIKIHAMLSNAGIKKLNNLLPKDAKVTVQQLEGAERISSRRTGCEQVDAIIQAYWHSSTDQQTVYKTAIKNMMLDFISAIQDSNYQPLITPEDGISALKIAVKATQLAQQNYKNRI
jgi:predicted dehydrogenase